MKELRPGMRIRTREGVTISRRAADFPGWGDPNYRDFLLDVPAGLNGRITSVNHHGSNPWTRYSVLLEDGSTIGDAVWGRDFDAFAN